ncbi:MAG TPA: ArsI/CadI family heavy metal resistance metalloenzyme [Chloroflexia bacterium]|nr:ArsI/CadI family heavy metal resistance metalloenzyme [Chloroflexia bacterium]
MTTEIESRKSVVEFAGTTRVHVAINVSDVERSLPFYKILFGQEPAKLRPGYAKFEVAEPAVNFTLNQNPNFMPGTGALSHFGIQVKSTGEVLAAKQRFIESGLATFDEENVTCCYAVQDKVWVTDPDGNNWEVFVVLEADAPVHSENRQLSQACACDTGANTSAATVRPLELVGKSPTKCC